MKLWILLMNTILEKLTLQIFFKDMLLSVSFLTRIPISKDLLFERHLMDAAWSFPLIGGLVGFLGGMVALLLSYFNISPIIISFITIGAIILLTGGLHEDGLADTADGFGINKNPEGKINIMRDSQIGVYGTLALIIAISVKAVALSELINKDQFFACVIALIVSGALSRSTIVGIAFFLEKASETGLASVAGKPRATVVGICFLISILLCIFLLPLTKVLAAILLSIVTTVVIGFLSKKQINGYTGDILGAAQMLSETALLIYLATSKM